VSKDPVKAPLARSWRDIPQQVKPRALSREGRRRFAVRGLRGVIGLCILGVAGWAGWEVKVALERGPGALPAADALPIGDRVVPLTDGVLDKAWLVRALALPPHATLMGIDPKLLQARVLASGQVATAAIVRHFPRELAVHMSERQPVARVMARQAGGAPQIYLVARDGVVYAGACYDPEMIKTLPWLDGVTLTPQGTGFAPLPGMDAVAELLARAQLEAKPLYETWKVVSLAHLAADDEIEVRTAAGVKVIFGAREDFFRQLARLDFLLDAAARQDPPRAIREINLALGSHVPVAFAPLEIPPATPRLSGRPAPAPVPPPFVFQSSLSREF
jgi:hypothetical protein